MADDDVARTVAVPGCGGAEGCARGMMAAASELAGAGAAPYACSGGGTGNNAAGMHPQAAVHHHNHPRGPHDYHHPHDHHPRPHHHDHNGDHGGDPESTYQSSQGSLSGLRHLLWPSDE